MAETTAPKAAAWAAASDAVPTVIADNVNIIYKVTAGSGGKGTAASAFRRILKRQDRPTIREVHAVKNVSFTAYKGDAIGLIGRNGSGKSTLLRAIAGLLPPASGAIYTGGQPSLLGVNAAMMNDLTGDRNVVLGCLAMGMSLAEIEERYGDIVEFSGIGDFIDLPMSTYSSGMSARLKFAIASAKTHDILLVDEAPGHRRRRVPDPLREEDQGTPHLGRLRLPGQPQPRRRPGHLQPRHLARQGCSSHGRRRQGSSRGLQPGSHRQTLSPPQAAQPPGLGGFRLSMVGNGRLLAPAGRGRSDGALTELRVADRQAINGPQSRGGDPGGERGGGRRPAVLMAWKSASPESSTRRWTRARWSGIEKHQVMLRA
ncbi:ABC transporter ATP-binding protein [Kribbella qitaiheensis]|uniref:ABC transporter ATP-binding protein n=1 Tax=Kribbella qitaiheensis TaxID=1544730 RepID=UPI001FE5CC6B|nr:ATP-binding cassette domain-containing protein [Kribbella qitaiheensis]